VMPLDRMPFINLGIVVPASAAHDSHQWRTDTSVLWASVRFDAGGYSNGHVQGESAALRELAAELAGRADQSSARALAKGMAG
jgi:hypothetical protein